MSRIARKGGTAASIVLIALGIAALAIGVVGRETVRHDLAREQIVGPGFQDPRAEGRHRR